MGRSRSRSTSATARTPATRSTVSSRCGSRSTAAGTTCSSGPRKPSAWAAATSPPPSGPNRNYQGGVSMGFYNMARGDAAYFRSLADRYALADNYHQPILGGTTANYFALATADVGFYTADGSPRVPPAKMIENPDPQPGTNNWYTEDGYQGGTLVACADRVRARRRGDPRLSREPAVPGLPRRQLRARALLHGQQSRARLPAGRRACGKTSRKSACCRRRRCATSVTR